MPGSVSNTFNAGDTVDAAKLNENFADLAGYTVAIGDLANQYSLMALQIQRFGLSTDSGSETTTVVVPSGQTWKMVEAQLDATVSGGTNPSQTFTVIVTAGGSPSTLATISRTTTGRTQASGTTSIPAGSTVELKLASPASSDTFTGSASGVFFVQVKHLA